MATMIVMAKDGKPTVLEDFPQTLFTENEHKSREMESRTGGSRYLRVSPSGLQQCFSLYLQQKQKDEGCTPEFERPQQNSRPPAVSYSAQIVAEVNDSSSPSVEPSFVEGKKVQLRVLIHTVGVLNAEREHVGNRGRRKTDSMMDNHGILRKIGRRGVIKR